MAEKSARSKEVETELTLEQVKDQLTELGKKLVFLHMKILQNVCLNLKLNQTKWMNIMNF